MLENCQNNISMYGYSPIQGKFFYSCGNFTKPGSQSEKYIYIFKIYFALYSAVWSVVIAVLPAD